MFKKILFLVCFFTISNGFSTTIQSPAEADSLEKLILLTPKDTMAIQNWMVLAEYYFDKNLLKSKQNAGKSFQLAKNLQNTKGKAIALYHLAKVERTSGKLNTALKHVQQSEKYFEKINNQLFIGKTTSEQGNIYAAMGNLVKAFEYYQKSIEIFESLSYEMGIASSYSELGNTHFYLKNNQTAIRYFKKAITIFEKEKDFKSVAQLYNRVSNVYRNLGEFEKSLEYNYYALMIQEKIRDKSGIAQSNCNIAKTNIYKDNLSSSKGYIDYSIKLFNEIGDQLGLTNALLISAEIDVLMGNYVTAREILDNCVVVAQNSGALKELTQAYQMLANVYELKGNSEKAYENLKAFTILKDSLYSEEKTKIFSEMEVKYRTKTKEKELLEQKIKNKQKTSQILLAVSIFSMFAISFVIVIILMNKRNKERKEANKKLESTNELIKRKNKEVIDSIEYAKRIQDAVLTPQKNFKHMFNDHFLFYQPKDIVSGDFYWAYQCPVSNKSFWVIADCTGHGVPGALMSVIGSIMLNEIVVVGKIHEPDKIIKKLSSFLKKYINTNDNISRDGIELSLFVLNKDNGKLRYCGANGKALIIKNSGELIDLKSSSLPVGYDPFDREYEDFEVMEVAVETNDWIIAFTDGYPDQLGFEFRKKYKIGLLKNNLSLWVHNESSVIEENLKQSMKQWMANTEQVDDMLVFGAKL